MKFGQAIDSVLFKNYFNLEGRATRSEYWWFMLSFLFFNMFVGLIVWIVAGETLGVDFNPNTFSSCYSFGVLVVFMLPLLGLSVRRFADAGRGRIEAIVVFVLLTFTQLVGMGVQGAIIQIADVATMLAWCVIGVTGFYTLYIALKKSV
tara:strand:+ start:485 stop:931 length:447 start_codon:yes stop_codon:yes gene_type:complete